MKTASYLVENLLDPRTSHSDEPTEAAWQLAHRTPLPCYEWLEEPENIASARKFPNAMRRSGSALSFLALNFCTSAAWFITTLSKPLHFVVFKYSLLCSKAREYIIIS